jgi:hypothetical protein
MNRVIFISILLIVGVSFYRCTRSHSAANRRLQSLQFLRDNKLELKKLQRSGFELHFNCDSVPFLKSTKGDTTKIWTASVLSWYEQHALEDNIDIEKFGQSQ